jgi:L-seryl-tRNA(Ser) seleniumtransferase
MEDKNAKLRALPKVDELMGRPDVAALAEAHGRELVLATVRETLDAAREAIKGGGDAPADWAKAVGEQVTGALAPSLRPVVNATGIIVHTNLGRAVLAPEALEAVRAVGGAYSTLEYDVATGQRGSRHTHIEPLLTRLTGAEAAMAVNNNAAAVLIVLACLARRREVIVSRGQLVEIGGSFRIPDIMRESGAKLVEVGATNKTHLDDYRAAITDRTAMLLKVHASNFKITGFTEDVALADLVALGREHSIPVVEDQGSGVLLPLEPYGLPYEPTVSEALEAGADLVTCSGDKLFGGPQAGLIVGKKALVDRLKKHPLARALRIDKMTLAALEATLRLFLDPDTVFRTDPTLRALTITREELRPRCETLAARLREALGAAAEVTVQDDVTHCGGGALPTAEIPTVVVAVALADPTRVEKRLRAGEPPVVARIKEDRILLDTRTMLPGDEDAVVRAMTRATRSKTGSGA